MRRGWLRSLVVAAAAPIFALTIPTAAPADPGVLVYPGMEIHQGTTVCTLGFVDPGARTAFTAGHCRGTVESVNNGWFTMANGIVSQKGDSGGPVYVVTPDGRAAIVGMFNSTWGNYPAAVSWQTASQQAREDVVQSASSHS